MGSPGIWWYIPAGSAVGCLYKTLYYRSGKWKLKKLT
jgi:Na+-driven multidrug efflux pump